MTIDNPLCRKCNIELNTTNWYPSNQKGHQYICIDCVKQRSKENKDKFRDDPAWREKRRQYMTKYINKRYHEDPEFRKRFIKSITDYALRNPDKIRDARRRREGIVEHEKICVICGKCFKTFLSQKKTCSDECSNKLRLKNIKINKQKKEEN
jgi:predicted nucleic acid-binding Zn ribbon protein